MLRIFVVVVAVIVLFYLPTVAQKPLVGREEETRTFSVQTPSEEPVVVVVFARLYCERILPSLPLSFSLSHLRHKKHHSGCFFLWSVSARLS